MKTQPIRRQFVTNLINKTAHSFGVLFLFLGGLFWVIPVHAATNNVVTDKLVLNLESYNTSSYAGSGNIWTDTSPFGHDATLVDYLFEESNYFVFNGTTSYATILSDKFLTAHKAFTMEVWFRGNDFSGTQTLLMKATSPDPIDISYSFQVIDGQTSIIFTHGTPDSIVTATSATLFPDQWYQVVAIWKKHDAIDIYINGAFVSETLHTVNKVKKNVGSVVIGANESLGAPFNGDIGAVRLYDKGLTPEEIQQNYTETRQNLNVTITFVTNGGTPVTTITQGMGTSFETITTKLDYTFDGWFTEVALTNLVPNTYYIPVADATYYAKWLTVIVEPPVVEPPVIDPPGTVNGTVGIPPYIGTITRRPLIRHLEIETKDEVELLLGETFNPTFVVKEIFGFTETIVEPSMSMDESINNQVLGTYKVLVVATHNNMTSSKEIMVHVVDHTAPMVHEQVEEHVVFGQPLDLLDIEVSDNYDETVTVSHQPMNQPQMPGTYVIEYTVTDSSNNQTHFNKTIYIDVRTYQRYRIQVGSQVFYMIADNMKMDLSSLEVRYQLISKSGHLYSLKHTNWNSNISTLLQDVSDKTKPFENADYLDYQLRVTLTDGFGHQLSRDSKLLNSLTINQSSVPIRISMK